MEQSDDTIVDVSTDYIEVDTSDKSDTSTNSIKSNYCSICLETEQINTKYIKFPCQHIFHVGCFENYFDYNVEHKPNKADIECPICRTMFSTNVLKNVFNICHDNPDENITILIPNNDITTDTSKPRGCTKADITVILLLALGLTLYLLAVDNII